MPPEPVVAVEIGTSKVIALVGELREDNHVMITGMGEHPSAGIRKGEITHLEHAGLCLKSALAMAEENGRVAIRSVHLAVTGGHVRSLINRGTVPVLDPDGEVTEEDAEEVMEVARAVNLPHDCEVLHTICQHFTIDDQQRVVRPEGNPVACEIVDRVFEIADTAWRGIGMIPMSGLAVREAFGAFDAARRYGVKLDDYEHPKGCSCGLVMRGRMQPSECPLFGNACTPPKPVGPCMVSSEGACAVSYKYGDH